MVVYNVRVVLVVIDGQEFDEETMELIRRRILTATLLLGYLGCLALLAGMLV